MDPSLQRIVLLPLAALVPVVAYASARADLVVAIAGINVVLIWISLRVATGGSPQPKDTTSSDSKTETTNVDR
ncbi:hypothetical protein JCM17823_06530 [Halorubrum gandharaense]